MKYLYLVILLLLLTVQTSAQTLSNSSGLSVLQKKWRINLNSVNSSNSALNEDPFRANNETNQTIQDQKDNLQQNEIRQRMGLPPVVPRVRIKPFEVQNRNGVSTSYTYQIKVRNNGTKTIKKVVWDYVFFNSHTNQEVGRHQFISETNLKPHETENLVMKQFMSKNSAARKIWNGAKLKI